MEYENNDTDWHQWLTFQQRYLLKRPPKNGCRTGRFCFIIILCELIGKLFFGFMSDKFSKKGIMIISIANLLLGS